MEGKKIPFRMCVACKESKPKKDLIRILRTDNGEFVFDKTGKMNGRGTYICDNDDCINKLLKQKVLNKVFKCNINPEVYNKLKEQFFENR
jgi:predicted RNA-binding protein YlxR (DUF448 family)